VILCALTDGNSIRGVEVRRRRGWLTLENPECIAIAGDVQPVAGPIQVNLAHVILIQPVTES
jgi:hypothetical protein